MLEGQAMQGRGRKIKGGNWDNCNSIINKIYFKKQLNLKKTKTKANSANMWNRNRFPEIEITWRVICGEEEEGEWGEQEA